MGCVGGAQKKAGLKDNKSAAAAQVEPVQEKPIKDKQEAPHHEHPQPPEQSAIDRAKQHSDLHEKTHQKPPSEVHPGHQSFLSEKEHPAKPASVIKEADNLIPNSIENQVVPDRKSGVQSRVISEIRSSIKNQLKSGLQSIHEQDEIVREEGQHNFSIPTKGLNLHVEIS